jgi:hypothetical protein
MAATLLRRALYRMRQFAAALAAYRAPLRADERAAAEAWLPQAAWPLFESMPRNDQRHSVNVLRALVAAGHDEPALMQAALLHDVAKSTGGVTLLHRVAAVLIKAIQPDWPARIAQGPTPARRNLCYPFWAHANHPRLGAELAATAGCDPLAAALIRRHQEVQRSTFGDAPPNETDRLLAALQAVDDAN